jgi:hypothetical protein
VCFEQLKKFCDKHIYNGFYESLSDMPYRHYVGRPSNVKLFCLTPVNYDLVKAEQGFQGTRAQLSRIMAERYKELEYLGCNIDLHLHLGLRLENINQEKMMKEALAWMHKHKFCPRFVTYGWYISDEESRRCEKKFGIKLFNSKQIFNMHLDFHDYEFSQLYSPMMILQNIRGMLR